jgi:hypothetical protein
MPKKQKPSFEKRRKEIARQQRMKDKAAARIENKERKATADPRGVIDEDPDIAGIRPGPQPLPEHWQALPTDIYGGGDEDEDEDEES